MMVLNKNIKFEDLPNTSKIETFVDEILKYLFIGFFEKVETDIETYRNDKKRVIEKLYKENINNNQFETFILLLDEVNQMLEKDLDFFYESDPACTSKEEIVLAYPGYKAITYYRIAHVLYGMGERLISRLISEQAHALAGIDIHPGAKIDAPFFIDHGTGIVIGETTEIGKYVKIYQGVTLGALSLKEGNKLKGKKRHPTIKDYVTIYSGSSILGGDTVIEDRVTVGSNVFIVNSVLKDTTVIYHEDKVKFINK